MLTYDINATIWLSFSLLIVATCPITALEQHIMHYEVASKKMACSICAGVCGQIFFYSLGTGYSKKCNEIVPTEQDYRNALTRKKFFILHEKKKDNQKALATVLALGNSLAETKPISGFLTNEDTRDLFVNFLTKRKCSIKDISDKAITLTNNDHPLWRKYNRMKMLCYAGFALSIVLPFYQMYKTVGMYNDLRYKLLN